MKFEQQFEQDYREWFRGMEAKKIIEYEQNLSVFIDSDLFDGFVLADEVLMLYELIRDECVYRVSKLAES